MSVVAKFRCEGVHNRATHNPNEVFAYVEMKAVYETPGEEQPEEDKHFATATPQGDIKFACTNPEALAEFQPGDFFYVRFEKA